MTDAARTAGRRMTVVAALTMTLGIAIGVVVGDGMRPPCPPPSKRTIVRTTPSPAPTATVAPMPGGVVFEAERDGDSGLFVIRGRTTGDEIAFAVDTGAEITIVRERDAETLGAQTTTDGDQNVVVVGSVLPMTGAVIPRMRIANVDLENVRVLVGPDTLPFSLLGQHEISRLGSVEFDGDTMRVRPSNVPESLD